MIVRSLDMDDIILDFERGIDEELFSTKMPYLSAIEALMYLAN